MKALTFISGILLGAFILYEGPAQSQCNWTLLGSHIYNNNAGNVGVGNNAPATLLYVAKNMTEPTITVRNLGGNGGATYAMVDDLSGANWKFKATMYGGFKIRDHGNLLDVLTIEANSLVNALYIKQGGNIGLGLTNPQENLHLSGAAIFAQSTAAVPAAGAIQWDGVNFLGYDGFSWINLDYWNDPWILGMNIPLGNPEFSAGPQPMSLSFAFPGIPNPMARLYVTDMSAPGIFPHQVEIETVTAGAGALDASQLFRISSNMNPPFIDFSLGIFGGDGTFKLTATPTLVPTAQGDGTSLLRAIPSGIIDFPNQSRIRAYQTFNPNQQGWQPVISNTWTPVNFDTDVPLNMGWDQHGEFTIVPKLTPAPPVNAYFTAAAEGYYQLNARVAFEMDEWFYDGESGPVIVNPHSYVLIAIYVDDNTGGGYQLHALGNKLQIADQTATGIYEKMMNNNGPNVSDLVYLNAGDKVAIYVFHSAATVMNLVPGNAETYVSIHKLS